MEDDDLEEGVGESSSPHGAAAAARGGTGGGGGFTDIGKQIYDRLVELRNEEAISDPTFREQLQRHFERLPARSDCLFHLLCFAFSLELLMESLLYLEQLFHRFDRRQGGGRAVAPQDSRRMRRP